MDKLAGLLANIGLVLFAVKGGQGHPLGVWKDIGSSAYVLIINDRPTSRTVVVTAEAVDQAVRNLGTVVGLDSARFRLPYADTEVTFIVDGCITRLTPSKPILYRIRCP